MKKMISIVAAGIFTCCALSAAQSIKVVNTFGGDVDSTGGSDLFVFDNQKNDEGSYKNEFNNTTRASDRLQLDVSDKIYDARLRAEIGTTKLNGKESTLRFRGYGRFKPVEQFQLIAGNDLFTKVPVNAGYLAASDDYPKYARILQNGFGLISAWSFGDDISMNFAGGLKGTDDSFLDKDKLGLDFGFNCGKKELFSVGGSFQNVTGNKLTVAVFASLNAVENLTLNAGYIYNNTDTDYITKAAKNSVSLSAGYDFKEIGFFLGADLVAAFSNEYIDGYDTKKYEKDGDKLIPLASTVRVSYKATDSLTVGAKVKLATMLGDNDSIKTELYPNVSYNLPNKMGSLTTGVRMNLDKDGLAKFAIPLSWKVTLADIKK